MKTFKQLAVIHFVLLHILPRVSGYETGKFLAWFPQFENALSFSWQSGGQCHDIYDDFVGRGQGVCGNVLGCILENTDELRKSTIASAQVVLGILPPLLSALGTSIPEISLLGPHYPLLTALVTLGAPCFFQTRLTEFAHPDGTPDAVPFKRGLLPSP